MKFGRAIATALSLALLASTPALGAVKAGATCKKIGTTKFYKGKTYTCVKSGKKLVWNKSVAIKTAAPTPTPSPTPTTSYPEEPKSLLDIKSYEQITYWAWKKSSDKIANSESKINEVEILIGPNSGILNKDPLFATKLTSRLFSGYAQPTKLTFLSYSYSDIDWAQNQIETLLDDKTLLEILQAPNRGGRDNARGTCPSVERCHSSQPFTNRAGKSLVIAGFTPSRLSNEGETKGELQSHEFTHVIQQHQYIGSPRELEGLASIKQFAPWWLVEGGADFGGFAAMNHTSYENYQSARMRDVLRTPKQSSEWFVKFINPDSNQYWIQFDSSGEIYNVGFMVTEIFTALKGPDSQMELFRLIANGKTMDDAFETIFGMPWKTAVPLIAKLISDERAKY